MKKVRVLLVCLLVNFIQAFGKLPGPLVYVVTPSPGPLRDEGRSAPFYYHNWMRRMDTPNTTTTTTTPIVKTPDLIFAEFEADKGDNMRKSIRKLLEKEKFQPKTSTTLKPIYVPDVTGTELPKVVSYEPSAEEEQHMVKQEDGSNAMEDYFAQYNSLYNNAPAPVYLPSTTTKATTTTSSTTTSSTTTAPVAPMNVENIWHIIDNEKTYNQHTGNWEEVPLNEDSQKTNEVTTNNYEEKNNVGQLDENYALPGFATNPGNGAENESRAIRTEPNFRFPYVDLKTFQMKNTKPLHKSVVNNKKSNNMFTNLDNFRDVKNPVRGEAQDVMRVVHEPIDRYNPAQPYLPDYGIGTKSKQSSSAFAPPMKAVANLIPPPPPPKSSDALQPPTNYESFPPYAPSGPPVSPPPPPSVPIASKPATVYQPPLDADTYDSPPSDSADDEPMMDLGYRYKPPSAPKFVPTLPPVSMSKPFSGYSYDKPPMMDDSQPAEPPFKGYSYDNPMMNSAPPTSEMDQKPQYGGYHYDKPVAPPEDPPSFSYGHHDHPPYSHDSHGDYPELIFNKHHGNGGMGDMKGGDDMKGNDMGMVPPPPPSDMQPDMSPPDDHGFPHDFPHDFKFNFDDHDHDHDYYHHHHHHPTTTTTTTEMPRVNRYSYYYLGKKLYYLPLYFSVYFIVYVGALIIKAVLRHKIVYPNSWRPNDQTASFFSKRSVDSWVLSNENLHEVTGRVTRAISEAYEKYTDRDKDA